MRIAMVSEHASPLAVLGGVDAGGQNVHVASLSRELGRRGMEVRVFTRRDDPNLAPAVSFAPGVTVEHVGAGPAATISKDDLFPYMEEFARALSRSWSMWRPDIVHAHFWMSGYAALLARAGAGAPVVQTFHALGVVKKRHQGSKDTSPPERVAVENEIVQSCERIIATCTDEVFELLRLGTDIHKASVIPCGVDTELFSPSGPAMARSQRTFRIVVVSRLVERKGIGNVIEALASLPNAELLIAGGPPKRELGSDREAVRLRALADRTGVTDRVQFLGCIDREDVPKLLRSADVCASVPWYEPFGIVPLEAMACRLPVVASAVGGLIDTVVDGVTGLHVPPRDPDRVAEALAYLAHDPEHSRALGRAGSERARSRYSWERVASATLEVYASVLAGEADRLHGVVR